MMTDMSMTTNRVFVYPCVTDQHGLALEQWISDLCNQSVQLHVEYCYHVLTHCSIDNEQLLADTTLQWLLTDQTNTMSTTTQLHSGQIIEIGPRLACTSAFSTNAVSVCAASGLHIQRIERSTRYMLTTDHPIKAQAMNKLVQSLHDRMTECEYMTESRPQLHSINTERASWNVVDVMGDKTQAMRNLTLADTQLGLAFDEQDMVMYLHLFREVNKRNPTDIELFDLAQSNSEHSRHWFFKAKLILDGVCEDESLMQMVQNTQTHSNQNSLIKFSDNSSALYGFPVKPLQLTQNGDNQLRPVSAIRHLIFTAETHNFPTGVCPFAGAATGTGGRLRDVQATGRGAHEIAGICGYSFGNLLLPDYNLPWESADEVYPTNFAHPARIAIEASNGASDYGNKFGEPVVTGFARSFGQRLGVDRHEFIKPIMFSAGIGSIDHQHLTKTLAAKGMLVVKLGGPVYRIGLGGGSASSVKVQGNRDDQLDFSAVQRGDPEMEQKVHRVVRACTELGDLNPIQSIHDQGAGGNGNVLKEIVEGAGAVFECSAFELGDPSISVRELWAAEYQESNAALILPQDLKLLRTICKRERCPMQVVGTVTNDNKVVLRDFDGNLDAVPVDLDLTQLESISTQKTFHLNSHGRPKLVPMDLAGVSVMEALCRVLRLPSVASKRYLTHKVDRSVTGLVAQQQCVGPLQTPLADVAVIALTHYDTVTKWHWRGFLFLRFLFALLGILRNRN